MAGIEKVCELCGEHCGGAMYQFKRDLIQVCPTCKKRFKHQKAYLHTFEPGAYAVSHYYSRGSVRTRILRDYVLEVPGLPGRVGGYYLNWTYHMSSAKRRLIRMLGCRKDTFEVVHHHATYSTWAGV